MPSILIGVASFHNFEDNEETRAFCDSSLQEKKRNELSERQRYRQAVFMHVC
jgi:hypothetical protein